MNGTTLKNRIPAVARSIALSLVAALAPSALRAQSPAEVPALDLAVAASDAVCIGRAHGVTGIRVEEVLAGTLPGDRVRIARGARLSLHNHPPFTNSLLFLKAMRDASGRPTYALLQYPGTQLRITEKRVTHVRQIVHALGLARRRAIGAVHAILTVAEATARVDATLARAALRALARRPDLVAAELMSLPGPRLAKLVHDAQLSGPLRAEATCCLAALRPGAATSAALRVLRDSATPGYGRAIAPLLVQIDRRGSASRVAALLPQARSGKRRELVRCLHAMGAAAHGELARLYADPALREALQRSMRSGKSPSRSKIR